MQQQLLPIRVQESAAQERCFQEDCEAAIKADNRLKMNRVNGKMILNFFYYLSAMIFVVFILSMILYNLFKNILIPIVAISVFLFIIFRPAFLAILYLYNFRKYVTPLIKYNDIRSVGLITRLAYITKNIKQQDKILNALLPLIESLTKEDETYFPEKHQDALRHLVENKRIRADFPDLLQAMIIALYTLRTDKNKAILQKMAQETPIHDAEKWIPKAAQSCLDSWYFDASGNPTLPFYGTSKESVKNNSASDKQKLETEANAKTKT
jgi:NADH:ubiquinone oxidoreductase subunit 3 (subunit A)